MARVNVSKRSEIADRLGAISRVAERFEAWRPAAEVLTRVRVVPTIFAQVNRALRTNGWPLQRIGLIHGPSSHGKTTFAHGLGLSFLRADGFYGFIDAEMTTPEDWLVKLMSEEFARHPGFVSLRPKSYEQTVAAVRDFCDVISQARDKGELPEDTPAIIVLDSLRKLVPDRLMENILKGKGGVDGQGGTGAMYRAALTGQWLDELVPLMHHSKTAFVIIARESQNTQKQNKFDPDWRLQGGNAPFFDSSTVARITRDGWVKHGEQVLGESHRVRIYKTKVAALEGKATDCWFHTSNGAASPEGFDLARDAFDLAVRLQIIERPNKTTYSYKGEVMGRGEHQAIAYLARDPDLLLELNGKFVLGEGEVPAEAEAAAEAADAASGAEEQAEAIVQSALHQRSRRR